MDQQIQAFIELLRKEIEVSEQIAEWWEHWQPESISPDVPHIADKDEMGPVYRKRAVEARRLIKQFSSPNYFKGSSRG